MTRVTGFDLNSLVHCIKRGAFGMDIFKDKSDYWRFVRLLYLCNDEFQDHNVARSEVTSKLFVRPPHWPERKPLTDIVSWCAMPNHFHLLLCEKREGGIGKFMQRLGGSFTKGFNIKYSNQGSPFQAKYKPVILTEDSHLHHLIPYINVKNVMELYPHGGLRGAIEHYDDAWKWAKTYEFSSFKTFALGLSSPILAMDTIHSMEYPNSELSFKAQAKECIEINLTKDNPFGE